MAINFLGLSPAYVAATSPDLIRQQNAVAKHLKANYKAGRGQDERVFTLVKAELEGEGLAIEFQEFRRIKAALRNTFMWLSAAEAGRAKIQVLKAVVFCFEQDGIRNWDDVAELAGLPKGKSKSAGGSAAPHETSEIRASLKDSRVGKEIAALVDTLLPKLEDLLQENAELKQAALEADDREATSRRQMDESQLFVRVLEEEIAALENRVRAVRESMKRARGETLAEIAAEHPEYPQLILIAQEMQKPASKKDEECNALLAQLPKIFTWENEQGQIRYEKKFLGLLAALAAGNQRQVIGQLEMLAADPTHNSLQTKKCLVRPPHTPEGSMFSRGSDELRFTWKKTGKEIAVYWLYRRGDSDIRQSEA